MNEEWRDIKGYEGKYQVSNLGRVKSLNYKRTKKEKILKDTTNNKGYKYVTLSLKGEVRKFLIHRLVAEAFIDNPNKYKEINHKDENKSNNRVNNLEWCTHKYNNSYGTKNVRHSVNFKGCKNPNYGKKGKYAPQKRKIQCITTGKKFDTIKEAAEYYSIENVRNVISRCCSGKYKSAGKHPVTGEKLVWKYLDDK